LLSKPTDRRGIRRAVDRQLSPFCPHALGTELVRRLSQVALAQRHAMSLDRLQQAWFEVWSLLQLCCPELPRRIGTCESCSSLIWRYRAANRFCGACGMAQRLLKGQETNPQVVSFLLGSLDHIKLVRAHSERQFGKRRDADFRDYYGSFRRLLLMPVVNRVEDRRDVLSNVQDPAAFVAIWMFVFEAIPRVQARVFVCDECGLAVVRDDLR
jgi:hypothetical protein